MAIFGSAKLDGSSQDKASTSGLQLVTIILKNDGLYWIKSSTMPNIQMYVDTTMMVVDMIFMLQRIESSVYVTDNHAESLLDWIMGRTI